MTKEHFEETLHVLLRQEPFQPFVIEMNDGRQWQFNEPHLVVNGGGAGFISDDAGLVDFSCDDVRQITISADKGVPVEPRIESTSEVPAAVAAYEGTVECGQIQLRDQVILPEHARVFVLVPDVPGRRPPRLRSPRLVNPQQITEFTKTIVDDADATV